MQVHSLDIEDFYEDNYTLIAIHTALEDFKLAYLLNNNLELLFMVLGEASKVVIVVLNIVVNAAIAINT